MIGRTSVAVQDRNSLTDLSSIAGLCEEGQAWGFVHSLEWGCLVVPSKQVPAEERKLGRGQESCSISLLICCYLPSELYLLY